MPSQIESHPVPSVTRSPLSNQLLRAGIGLSLGAIAQVCIGLSPALAASLKSWHYDPRVNELAIATKDETTPRYFLMAQPARIVIDLPDTSVGQVNGQKTYTGAVRSVRVSQFQPGLTRIVIELSADVSLAPGQVKLEKISTTAAGSRWVLRPLIVGTAATTPKAPTPPLSSTPAAKPSPVTPLLSVKPVAKPTNLSTTAPSGLQQPLLPTAKPSSLQTAKPASISAPLTTIPPTTPAPVAPAPPLSAPAAQQVVNPKPASIAPVPATPPAFTPAPTAQQATKPKPASVTPATSTPLTPPTSPSTVSSDSGVLIDTAGAVPITVPPPDRPPPAVSVPALSPLPNQTNPAPLSPAPAAPTPLSPAAPVTSQGVQSGDTDIPTTLAPAPTSTNPKITVPPLRLDDASSAPLGSSPFPPAPETGIPVPAVPGTSVVVPTRPIGATALSTEPVPLPVPPSLDFDAGATSTSAPPMVKVPSLAPPSATPTMPVQPMPSSSVGVPANNPAMGQSVAPTPAKTVSFGQPLPTSNPGLRQNLAAVPDTLAYRPALSGGLLPAGTTLNLRYPGTAPLKLAGNTSQQDVLLLHTDVRDENGHVLLPEGTPLIGRFETNSAGTLFIAQAISFQGQNIPLSAQSGNLSGNRQVSNNDLVRNAGIGVAAGGLIGGLAGNSVGLGVLGGAAAGAAATYLTAPKPATIQPGQVIQVRVN